MDADQLHKRITSIDDERIRQEPADDGHSMRISQAEASVCIS